MEAVLDLSQEGSAGLKVIKTCVQAVIDFLRSPKRSGWRRPPGGVP
jgi:hypothetical protein